MTKPRCLKRPKSRKRRGAVHNLQQGPAESTATLIERIMAEPIETTLNGESSSLTVFDAMILKLIQKCAGGSVQACAALLQLEIAGGKPDQSLNIEFVDSDDAVAQEEVYD